MRKIIYICEENLEIIDEGKKKIAFQFYNYLQQNFIVLPFFRSHSDDNNIKPYKKSIFYISKIFFEIRKSKLEYDTIFYFPKGTVLNFRSHIISRSVQILCRALFKSKLVFFSFQEKKPNLIRLLGFKICHPDVLVCFKNTNNYIERVLGDKNIIKIIPGVNKKKYFPIDHIKKNALRKKYNVSLDKFVLLHVGHANKGRGLDELLKYARIHTNCQVIIILSSLYDKSSLFRVDGLPSNIILIDEYIDAIDEYYKLSDMYVFPTISINSAIDYPLSIFESLACGTPVATRKLNIDDHGLLEGIFFYYDLSSLNKICVKVMNEKNIKIAEVDNWEDTIKKVIKKLKE